MENKRRILPIKLDSYKPLRELVSDALREAIMSGALHAGERLMEIQLAEELGVSRTPVREAIRKLELEGFVVMIPRKGAYVSDISLKDISDVFEIRTALDALAAGLAAERISEDELERLERLLVEIAEAIEQGDIERAVDIDTQFHDVLYKASRNDRLVGIIGNLRELFQRFRSITMGYPGRLKDTIEEHKCLVEAISQRNIELAQHVAREHMDNAEDILLGTLARDNRANRTEQ